MILSARFTVILPDLFYVLHDERTVSKFSGEEGCWLRQPPNPLRIYAPGLVSMYCTQHKIWSLQYKCPVKLKMFVMIFINNLPNSFRVKFCSTRKGTQQAGSTLIKDARFVMNSEHRQRFYTFFHFNFNFVVRSAPSQIYTKAENWEYYQANSKIIIELGSRNISVCVIAVYPMVCPNILILTSFDSRLQRCANSIHDSKLRGI